MQFPVNFLMWRQWYRLACFSTTSGQLLTMLLVCHRTQLAYLMCRKIKAEIRWGNWWDNTGWKVSWDGVRRVWSREGRWTQRALGRGCNSRTAWFWWVLWQCLCQYWEHVAAASDTEGVATDRGLVMATCPVQIILCSPNCSSCMLVLPIYGGQVFAHYHVTK